MLVVQVVREFVTPHGRVVDVSSQQSRHRWCREKFNIGAPVVSSVEAWFAGHARNIWLDCDPVAGLERLD